MFFLESAFLQPDQNGLRAFRSEKSKQMNNAAGMGHETEASVEFKLSFPDGFK
jgi:hypothetical protein